MSLKININKDKIKGFLFKVSWIAARHAFFACLVLFFIAFFFGVLLFNKCNSIIKTEEFGDVQGAFSLKRTVYERELGNLRAEQKRYEEANFKEYSNPFLRP
jgi:hypothetical protein